MDQKAAERVRTGDSDTPEYVDQTCWVPQGQEVVPAQLFLNGHAIALGRRYTSTESPLVDRLLANGLLGEDHHHTALKLLHLLKMGTSKQGYAVMQLFMPARGYDSSDFCPLSTFIHVTRPLKPKYMLLIKGVCGSITCSYLDLARNADLLRDALEIIQENFEALQEALENNDE